MTCQLSHQQAGTDSGCIWHNRRRCIFSKRTFVNPMCKNSLHVIDRFKNDAILLYPSTKKRQERKSVLQNTTWKWISRNLTPPEVRNTKLTKENYMDWKPTPRLSKRTVSLAVRYPDEDRADKCQLYFSTDYTQSALDVLEYYRTRFQLEFCFRDNKQYAGITNCQFTDFREMAFHFNVSLTAINLAKGTCKRMKIKYSVSSCKSVTHNANMLERRVRHSRRHDINWQNFQRTTFIYRRAA